MSIPAVDPGPCWVCGEPFNIGDPVVYCQGNLDSGWVHRRCFLTPIIAEARKRFNERHGQTPDQP